MMNKIIQIPLTLLLLSFLAQGCISAKKTFYAADLEAGVKEKIDQANYGELQKIQVGDVVQVTISALDAEQAALFNPFQGTQGGGGSSSGRGLGYQVDKNGQIEIPIIGQVDIAGLSSRAARDVIKGKVEVYIKQPWVDVSVLSYKVTFLGEVGGQGPITIPNERLSIIEGIAQAGGLPSTARYDRVWLIREENGERAYHLLNVNDKAILQSDFYYLRNNEIIYV